MPTHCNALEDSKSGGHILSMVVIYSTSLLSVIELVSQQCLFIGPSEVAVDETYFVARDSRMVERPDKQSTFDDPSV